MQQSGSVSKLKRQLGFIKSIDQKLEGLRRENERLRRLVSNPRVRFSRSSLGGLHRIVNSLKNSSETHELATVESWADKTKSWLIEQGKRGEGPSNDELDWLAETIRELGEIQDTVASKIGNQIKEIGDEPEPEKPDEEDEKEGQFDPQTLPPDAYDALEDMQEGETGSETDSDGQAEADSEKDGTTDEPIPENGDQPEPFPFNDEPRERSIAEAKFWKNGEKKSSKGFRERTSTIPLAINDLTSVSPPKADMTPPPPPPVPVQTPGFWRPFAILSFVGALVTAGLLYKAKQEMKLAKVDADRRIATANAACVVEPPPVVTQKNNEMKTVTKPDTDGVKTEEDKTAVAASDTVPSTSQQTEKETIAKVANNALAKKRPQKKAIREKKSKPPEKKTEKEPAKDKGTLVVNSPAEGGSVLVLVDGISRGKSPATIKLSPGLHQVTFVKDGKKKLRMVPIRTNATKTITAVIPE